MVCFRNIRDCLNSKLLSMTWKLPHFGHCVQWGEGGGTVSLHTVVYEIIHVEVCMNIITFRLNIFALF